MATVNIEYFLKIMKLAEEYKLEQAIKEYQKYIQNYPKHLNAYVFYADALIKANRLDEAEYVLSQVIITPRTPNKDIENLTMIKIKLLCCKKKYKECYELLLQNINIYFQRKSHFVLLIKFLKRELGILNESDISRFKGYLFQQLYDYNEEKALAHIQEHHIFDDEDSISHFVKDFPLKEVYYKIRKMLPLENKIITNGVKELYVFKYDANGHVNNKLVDFIQIVTFQDSNDIITMYPYENEERAFFIDISPVLGEEEGIKLKRVSQIDKFNQRYGKGLK